MPHKTRTQRIEDEFKTDAIRWEFVRRDPNYQEDWRKLSKLEADQAHAEANGALSKDVREHRKMMRRNYRLLEHFRGEIETCLVR